MLIPGSGTLVAPRQIEPIALAMSWKYRCAVLERRLRRRQLGLREHATRTVRRDQVAHCSQRADRQFRLVSARWAARVEDVIALALRFTVTFASCALFGESTNCCRKPGQRSDMSLVSSAAVPQTWGRV